MVTIVDKRDYWVSINNEELMLQNIDGVISVVEGQGITTLELEAIPDSLVEEWKINELKRIKIEETKTEGLSRIQAVIPAITDFDTLQLVKEMILSIAPTARQLTTNIQSASDIYQAGSDAISVLNNYTTLNEINNFDVVNDVSWP